MDTIIAARLEIISAKSKILAESIKNNSLWPGELDQILHEISVELSQIPKENN